MEANLCGSLVLDQETGRSHEYCIKMRGLELHPTFTILFRAALELRNAKSTAAWSIRVRFVASGSRASKFVSNAEGPGAMAPGAGD